MPNTKVKAWRESLLAALVSGDVRFLLVDASYTFVNTHNALDDVGSGARLAVSPALTGKSATDGYFSSDETTLSAVPAGDTGTQSFLYLHTGVESTSILVAYFDKDATGALISRATDGDDIPVRPVNGKWFRV